MIPLKSYDGYMFIRSASQKKAAVYEYSVTIFESANQKYRGIKTEFIDTCPVGLGNTFEKIKTDFLLNIGKFAHPAVYAVESQLDIPLKETLLPIAKRSLVRIIAKQERN